MKRLISIMIGFGALMLSGCAAPVATSNDPVGELTLAIQALDPDVDPVEARRAAEISYSYSTRLAQDYGVTTAPLVHNSKVNAGIKDRGLCYHYAEDMQTRLNQEEFKTLVMLRAIAEPKVAFLIDHSTAVIAARGNDIYDGVVLDAWRNGGELFWSPTVEDTRYNWEPRMRVLERKWEERVAREAVAG
ncbi:hypothetical protein GO984_10940 [Rhodobacteraceae bacterium CY05]|uniref:Lipoprotein n=2 Tax=Parasedimentitalea huanghaiensis TaxID=2682100 RepID=A0A6L6WIA0_9RHOB|nr:hypothetical protein [Zongyanglinia huanghaiensis]